MCIGTYMDQFYWKMNVHLSTFTFNLLNITYFEYNTGVTLKIDILAANKRSSFFKYL